MNIASVKIRFHLTRTLNFHYFFLRINTSYVVAPIINYIGCIKFRIDWSKLYSQSSMYYIQNIGLFDLHVSDRATIWLFKFSSLSIVQQTRLVTQVAFPGIVVKWIYLFQMKCTLKQVYRPLKFKRTLSFFPIHKFWKTSLTLWIHNLH